MALQGAIAGEKPGKKVVSGSISVTASSAVQLGALLQSIDSFQLSYATPQAATNAFVYGVVSGTQLVIVCQESDHTSATTAATIHYEVHGDAPR